MPFCRTCQEDVTFDEIDGLYYCSQCYGQSETMQVMEYSQFDSQPSQSFGMRSRTIKVLPASKKRTSTEIDETGERSEDDTWWLAEVFQIILKAQVDTLIEMGVTDKLKEVVKLMWFRYLQNSKWAFLKKQSSRLKDKNGKQKKGQPTKTKEKKEEQDNTDMTWNKSKNVPLDGELVKKLKFRLQHLLGILYAALRCLDEPILLTDLIRWALDGDLPYYGTSDILPKHLTNKFGPSESHMFLVAKPDMLHMSKLQEPVCHVLNVLDVPALNSVKLDFVISRFILSLNLPASFHQLTHHLRIKYPFTTNNPKKKVKKKRFVFEEGPSLAYIIVAMKLLFGLDGETERMTSEMGRVLRDKLPAGSKVALFIWDEWMASEKLRAKHHQINTKLVNPQASREVSDVLRFINRHTKAFLLDSKRESLNKSHKYQGQSLGSEMQRPFMKLGDQDEPSINGPSSFPYTMRGHDERFEEQEGSSYSRLSQGAPLNATSDIHWISKRELASYDFSKSSIDYILHLNKFCKKLGVDPESVLSDKRLEKRVAEKMDEEKVSSGAGVSQQRERKRKRNNKGGKSPARRISPSSQGEEDHDATIAAEGTSKNVRTKKQKTARGISPSSQGEEDHDATMAAEGTTKNVKTKKQKTAGGISPSSQGEEDHEATMTAEGTSKNAKTKKQKTRRQDDFTAAIGLRKTMQDVVQGSSTESDPEELPYEQWKEMVLSRTSGVDASSASHSVSDKTLQSFNVPYTRYKPVSVHQCKASMERDGEPSSWRPFHQSYQWLLEHCAALFGLEWYYIHEAVANLENQIFNL